MKEGGGAGRPQSFLLSNGNQTSFQVRGPETRCQAARSGQGDIYEKRCLPAGAETNPPFSKPVLGACYVLCARHYPHRGYGGNRSHSPPVVSKHSHR